MKSMLPIKFDIPVHGRCWDSIRLAAIMSDSNNIPWFLDKFLSIEMRGDYVIQSYSTVTSEHMTIYNDAIEYHEMQIPTLNSLTDIIINEINNNRYVLCIYDRFYIENNQSYKNEHVIHDILIYGYDSESEILFYYDVLNRGYCNYIMMMKFNQFRTAFFSGVKIMREEHPTKAFLFHNMPLISFSLKKADEFIDLWHLYNIFDNNLAGSTFINERTNHSKWHGIAIYKGIYEELFSIIQQNEKSELFDKGLSFIYGMKHLYEVKKSTIYRLKYLHNLGLLDINDDLLNNIELMCRNIEISSSLITKFGLSKNAKNLAGARKLLIEVEKSDRFITETICQSLSLQKKKMLDKYRQN